MAAKLKALRKDLKASLAIDDQLLYEALNSANNIAYNSQRTPGLRGRGRKTRAKARV